MLHIYFSIYEQYELIDIQYSSESISHVQNCAHSIAFSDRIMQR